MIKRFIRTCSAAGCNVTGLLRAAEQANKKRLTILCYHRILPAERKHRYFNPDLVVIPQAFRLHCRTLRRYFDVLPITSAIHTWHESTDTGRPIAAITFDDGYRDNHEYAAGVLADLNMQATFYVIAGLAGTTEAPWYDRLARLAASLDRVGRLQSLCTGPPISKIIGCHRNGSTALISPYALVLAAKKLDRTQRFALIESLDRAVGSVPAELADDLLMTWPQIEDIANAGHEIGAHSMTHEIMPALDEAALGIETAGARALLERQLGQPVRAFCYPNGDTDDRVVAAVRNAGFTSAVTTATGSNEPDQDPFLLRRWFIQEDRLRGSAGLASPTLLRMELSALSDRLFFRQHQGAATS